MANAFRHSLWQAGVASKYGSDVAEAAGNSHESYTNVDLSQRTFKGEDALQDADQTIDLLNNSLARGIGTKNSNTSTKDLAVITLDFFHEKGFFVATTNKDKSVSIKQTKLTDSQYKTAMDIIKGLNENGNTKEQQTSEDKKKLEQQQQTNMRTLIRN